MGPSDIAIGNAQELIENLAEDAVEALALRMTAVKTAHPIGCTVVSEQFLSGAGGTTSDGQKF